MVTEDDYELLAERLRFWWGAPPFDIGHDVEALVRFLAPLGVGAVFLDSLKDMAVDLAGDETGSRVNRALQLVVREGIQVFINHHQRKSTAESRQPKTLDDVYGSNWRTAGCGSVILLWGRPGDAVVELHHLKQVADKFAPMKIRHDHALGAVFVFESKDLVDVLRGFPDGTSAQVVARILFDPDLSPTPNDIEKARRKLNDLVRAGVARVEYVPAPEGRGGKPRAVYRLA